MTYTLTGMLSEDEFLEQSGVKGMKWGVTRDQAAGGSRKATKILAKADKKQLAEMNSMTGFIKINNLVANKMNGSKPDLSDGLIAKHNANPKYAGRDPQNMDDPKTKAYYDDYAKLSTKTWLETAKDTYGDFPSGKQSLQYRKTDTGDDYLELVDSSGNTLAHAASTQRRIYLKTDPITGDVLAVKPVADDGQLKHFNDLKGYKMANSTEAAMLTEDEFLAHFDQMDDDSLEHYGKKGMKWGQKLAEANLGVAAKARTSTGNDKSRAAGRGERNSAIDSARGRVADGTNKTNLKDAKVAYKASKHTEGRDAAKTALRAVRDKNADDYHDSRLAKSGGEAVATAALVVGGLVLQAALSSRG